MDSQPSLPYENTAFKLPRAVADVLRRRVASHDWDVDRVAAAAILYFIEHAEARAEMLRRLIEVLGGATANTPPEDVLEHHRDRVFGDASIERDNDESASETPADGRLLAGVAEALEQIVDSIALFHKDDASQPDP